MPAVVGFVSVRSIRGVPAARTCWIACVNRFGVRSPGTRDENIHLIDYKNVRGTA
jgi:hypothetical protein